MAGQPLSEHTDEVRAVLDAAPFPLIISRISDGTVLYANDILATALGMTPAELIGRKTPDFYADPGDRQALLEEVQRRGRVENHEVRFIAAGSAERWALISVVAIRLRGEDVLVAGLNDITERKTAEDSLRASEERFRSLVENANDIIYLLTTDGTFVYVSPNWTYVLGHDVSEIVGTHFAPLVHPDDLDRCYAFLKAVMETGEKHGGIEYRVRHKDGTWRWHTSNASSLKDDDGNPINFVGIARDITEKKEAQLALESALRELEEREVQLITAERMAALGRLVRGIAHEINSPVGAIRGMSDTLNTAISKLESHFGQEERERDSRLDLILATMRDAGRVIGQGATRVNEVVESLRSFTRLDEADLKQCDIHEGIDSTLTLIEHELRDRVEVVKDYGDFGPVVCYPRRLNQVFLNLLHNASQAIDGKGRITIRTRATDREIRVSIEDTGRGIPADQLKRIFEPRFTTRGERIVTGLSLSICENIMHQHHGAIEVESEPGRGSTFTVTIPRDLRSAKSLSSTESSTVRRRR